MKRAAGATAGPPQASSFTQPQGTRKAAAAEEHWQQQKKKKNNLGNLRFTFYPSGTYTQSGQKRKIEIPQHFLTFFPQDSPRPLCGRWWRCVSLPRIPEDWLLRYTCFSHTLILSFIFFNFLIHFFQ